MDYGDGRKTEVTNEEAIVILDHLGVKGSQDHTPYEIGEALTMAKCALENANKTDRPKGKWEWSATERIGLSYGGTGYVPIVKCSHCDRITKLYLRDEKPTEFVINYPNFCPNCGADMTEI